MKKFLTTIIIILSAHLWYCNADLLILSKEMAADGAPLTVFTYGILILFALSYSVMSAMAVVFINKFIYALIFALLDGIVVYLRINVDQPYFLYIVAVFYSLYTAYIVMIVWLLKHQPTESQPETTEPKNNIKAKMKALPEKSDPNYAPILTAVRKISASKDKGGAIAEIIATTDNEAVKAYIKEKYTYQQQELF